MKVDQSKYELTGQASEKVAYLERLDNGERKSNR